MWTSSDALKDGDGQSGWYQSEQKTVWILLGCVELLTLFGMPVF